MTNKLFTISHIYDNDHGCRGEELVIRPTSPTTGIVEEVYCCTSCWQRGCTTEKLRSLEEDYLGKTVNLPEWCDSWEDASQWEENECSFSNAGRTFVAPDDLLV